jgi:hypothetical protein
MMIGLLKKGIAIHHAGIMPILREMVELCNPGSTPEVTPEVKALIAKYKGDPT